MKDLFAYLFGDSQVESEIEETKAMIEKIMEEAEGQEPLKVKRTPLIAALKALGLKDVSADIQYDPEGLSLVCAEENEYRDYVRLLMEPDAMEKLAELGWVVTRCGDVAMSNEPAEFRIRFLEITTVDTDSKDEWPTGDQKLIKNVIKKGREFMDEPGPHDAEGPVEYDDKTSNDHKKGVGKEQDGKDPEGKPKGGRGKTESFNEAESPKTALKAMHGFQGKLVLNKPGSPVWRRPSPTCVVCGKPRRGVADRQMKANEVCSPACLQRKRKGSMGAYLPLPPAGTYTAWDALQAEAKKLANSALGVNEAENPKSARHSERCPHCEGMGYTDDEGNPQSYDSYMSRRDDQSNPVHVCHECKGTGDLAAASASAYRSGVERKVSKTLGRPYKFGEAGHPSGCPCGFCKRKGSFGKKAKESARPKSDEDTDAGGVDSGDSTGDSSDSKNEAQEQTRKFAAQYGDKAESDPPRYGDMYQMLDERKQRVKKVKKAYKLRRK